jgi:hyperosmotically inducible periplasmic protein
VATSAVALAPLLQFFATAIYGATALYGALRPFMARRKGKEKNNMPSYKHAIRNFTLAAAVAVSAAGSVPAWAGQLRTIKDGWLEMKIHSEMVDEDLLSGSNIDVDVDKGVVTLKGTVRSDAGRSRAIAVAKSSDGVKNVIDQLRIVPAHGDAKPSTADRAERAGEKVEHAGEKAVDKTKGAAKKTGRAIDDGWIKSKIYAQYLTDWDTVLDDSDIDVDVDHNVVTLNGTVKSAEAKAKAVSTAKATDGVKAVHDNLRVAAR